MTAPGGGSATATKLGPDGLPGLVRPGLPRTGDGPGPSVEGTMRPVPQPRVHPGGSSVSDDPSLRIALARTAYVAAIALRDATHPGDPGYHDAVLAVGLRWSQVRYWERRLAQESGLERPAVDGRAARVDRLEAVPTATHRAGIVWRD